MRSRITLVMFVVAACLLLATSAGAATSRDAWPLHVGSHGARVRDAEYLLHRRHVAAPARGFAVHTFGYRPDRSFGRWSAKATRDAYWKLGWPAWFVKSKRGGRYGPMLHLVLQGKAKRPLAYRITAGKRAWAATHHKPKVTLQGKVKRLVVAAHYLIEHRSLVHYSQSYRMTIVRWRLRFPPLTRSVWEDCSSAVTGLYYEAGLPDPNAFNYAGYGFTGTAALHGWVVWRRGWSLSLLKPGDLIFYGYYPFRHVAMYLGAGRVFSQGGESGPFNLPALYRSDAYYARRYF